MKKTKLTEEEKYKKLIDQDRVEAPSNEYTESNDVIDAANSALSKGKQFKNEVERQEFMKMNSNEKSEFLKGVQNRMKKRQGK